MKFFSLAILFIATAAYMPAQSQSASIDKEQFFSDTSMLHASLITNHHMLFGRYKKGYIIPGVFQTTLSDGTVVHDPVTLEFRGNIRHEICYVPPLKISFKNNKSSVFHSLKSLKLVNECKLSTTFDQYLLKEFLIYKIYNLITDMSFRVRLLDLDLPDSSGKKKTINEHAFLIEDIKELAKRNDCRESINGAFHSEETNRKQMTIVAVFQYMIGNTDWGVSVKHNIRLITPKNDSLARPYVIAYDFDYAGLVNTDYAVPDERLGIETVRERMYRGLPRNVVELNEVLDIFKQQKEKIYALINNFNLLTSNNKRDMTDYLDDFYKTINNPKDVQSVFLEK